ncbi:hypothetical protein Tco_0525810 [Tanacetum coccineum]
MCTFSDFNFGGLQDVVNSCRTGATTNVIFSISVIFINVLILMLVLYNTLTLEVSLLQVIGSPYTGGTSNLTTSSATTVIPTTSTVVGTSTTVMNAMVVKIPVLLETICVGDYMRAEARVCSQVHEHTHEESNSSPVIGESGSIKQSPR